MVNIKVIKGGSAPERITQPNSKWRKFFQSLEVGDWFEIPTKQQGVLRSGAINYGLSHRYTCYKHPTKENTHVFLLTK